MNGGQSDKEKEREGGRGQVGEESRRKRERVGGG